MVQMTLSASALSLLFFCAARVKSLAVTSNPLAASNKTYDYIVVGGGTAGLAVLIFDIMRPHFGLTLTHR